ncbi:hypothetical protein [Sediminibacillus sp. JSM 1682029]|uniref:hypothetical protein n=1 Tax=Sediminibacillus sp. JSM 1682029 TaxID=3229857 RepID=UPI003524F4DB
MIRLNKSNVKTIIRKDGCWTGFLVANRVHPVHIEGLWYLGMKVTIIILEELEHLIARYAYYNCNNELGNRVAFYVQKETKVCK